MPALLDSCMPPKALPIPPRSASQPPAVAPAPPLPDCARKT